MPLRTLAAALALAASVLAAPALAQEDEGSARALEISCDEVVGITELLLAAWEANGTLPTDVEPLDGLASMALYGQMIGYIEAMTDVLPTETPHVGEDINTIYGERIVPFCLNNRAATFGDALVDTFALN